MVVCLPNKDYVIFPHVDRGNHVVRLTSLCISFLSFHFLVDILLLQRRQPNRKDEHVRNDKHHNRRDESDFQTAIVRLDDLSSMLRVEIDDASD